jgi:hypothetical protein
MLWEDTTENAIVTLLQLTTAIPTIKRGIQDENPNLTLPALVVHAVVEERMARRDLYKLRVTIEYKTIPEESAAADIESAMQQVDVALTTQPKPAVTAQILASMPVGSRLDWQGVARTQQDVHTDRRTNTRELEVFLSQS